MADHEHRIEDDAERDAERIEHAIDEARAARKECERTLRKVDALSTRLLQLSREYGPLFLIVLAMLIACFSAVTLHHCMHLR